MKEKLQYVVVRVGDPGKMYVRETRRGICLWGPSGENPGLSPRTERRGERTPRVRVFIHTLTVLA